MKQTVVTKQLTDFIMLVPEKNPIIVDPENTDEVIKLLQPLKHQPLKIYDATINQQETFGAVIPVKDHVNRTGSNPIIGKQRQLGVDFTDLTGLYQLNTEKSAGVTAQCCGHRFLESDLDYPCGFMSNITILARILGWTSVQGVLVNIFKA